MTVHDVISSLMALPPDTQVRIGVGKQVVAIKNVFTLQAQNRELIQGVVIEAEVKPNQSGESDVVS